MGDSGGPLVHFSPDFGVGRPRYVQLGIVSGGVAGCGDRDLPGIYPRMDHPDILDFVKKVASGTTINKITCNIVTRQDIFIGAESVSFWSEWGEWSDCSEKCDEGVRTRTRGCISSGDPEEEGEVKCPDWGDKIETEPCIKQKCRN